MARLENVDGAQLAVDVRPQPGGFVVRLTGELDISSVATLQAALDGLLDGTPHTLTFDASALRFMDSSGLAVLLRAAATGPVRLRNPSNIVRRVLELTGVSDVVTIEP